MAPVRVASRGSASITNGSTRAFTDVEVDWGASFRIGGEEFARAIRDGTQPDMDTAFAREVFRFQLAALGSRASGRPLALSAVA